MSEWISTNEYVPSASAEVLVYAPECDIIGSILVGCYFSDSDTWTVYDFSESSLDTIVTHWMNLPDAP